MSDTPERTPGGDGNEFGWFLPLTDHMLNAEMPYPPLSDPAQNIAERLVMLAHLSFNSRIWSPRRDRYWPGFRERAEAATNNPDVATWWGTFIESIEGKPLRKVSLLHEKNLLCHPLTLPGTQVEDQDVLAVFRRYSMDLVDRARVWVSVRRSLSKDVRIEDGVEEDLT